MSTGQTVCAAIAASVLVLYVTELLIHWMKEARHG